MMAPFSPGFDFDRYDRELRRPFPSAPRFSIESAVWRGEHDERDALPHAKAVRYDGQNMLTAASQSKVFPGESL